MKFKRIQEGEARKIIKMIESNDPEMRKLAATILNIKERFRLTLISICGILSGLVVLTLLIIVYLGYVGAGWYLLPLIIGWLLQVFWSFGYIVSRAEARHDYDDIAKWISNE